ncbi:MAG: glycosyltransferase N-terminal domain-containing protein [Acidiferrobacter sp.]
MRDTSYEGGWVAAVVADGQDRLRGERGRANARWGFLRPPGGDGRVVWIKADGDEIASWLSGALAQAVLDRRQDVRVVVTFEHEYGRVVERLADLPRTGYGYGPADRPRAVARVLRRFAPAGVIAVGRALRTRLGKTLHDRKIPAIVVHGPPPGDAAFTGFPNSASEAQAWGTQAAATGALASMIVEAQVEPQFSGVAGAHARALWWIADVAALAVPALVAAWRASPLSGTDILFIGGAPGVPSLAAWDRRPFRAGSVVAVDDRRYWPALAASATAIHVDHPGEMLLWQVLAGGNVVSVSPDTGLDLLSPPPLPRVAIDKLLDYWQGLAAAPLATRGLADPIRRFFWGERRRAQAAVAVLLEQVYQW